MARYGSVCGSFAGLSLCTTWLRLVTRLAHLLLLLLAVAANTSWSCHYTLVLRRRTSYVATRTLERSRGGELCYRSFRSHLVSQTCLQVFDRGGVTDTTGTRWLYEH